MAHTNTKMPKTLQEIGNLDIEHLSQERISEIVTFIASNLKQQNVTRKPKMHKITTKDGQWPIKENLTAEDATEYWKNLSGTEDETIEYFIKKII